MYLSVKDVTPLPDYRLLLKFENDENRVFDVQPYLDMGKFSELKSVDLFHSVKVSFDSIEWANHLDFSPEFLYEKSIPDSRV